MTDITTFSQFNLGSEILDAIADLGFKSPSPIQAQCIPALLEGRDVLGVAQTGSGKTAAFSLPYLSQIDATQRTPQMLIMAPTRELAIQVADAIETFAKYLPKISIATLYGGQRYDIQLRDLRRGAQIVVGTPGRILDHIRKKTLVLSNLKLMVLDEADEMLRMGFIDDVETVMSELPEDHQTALFSATMPEPIKRITKRFMQDPVEIRIKASEQNAPDISQFFWLSNGMRKQEALLRFLEVEDYDAAIIFAKTKTATIEITDILNKNGLNAAALNGDMTQQSREQTLEWLKKGRLNILVATDVAARGLDVERISLVINYDITTDAESYVHRIGRTGRAGRAGRALLFVDNRERRQLRNIEHLIKKRIEEIKAPDYKVLETSRQEKFKLKIAKQLEHHDLEKYRSLLEDLFSADRDHLDIAAAMTMMLQGNQRLLLEPDPKYKERGFADRNDSRGGRRRGERSSERGSRDRAGRGRDREVSSDMDLYRIEVGRDDGVEVRHIVGAIANEADISSRYIGHIKLFNDYSTVELPKGMPAETLKHFAKTRVLNRPMQMSIVGAGNREDNGKARDRSRGGFRDRDRREKDRFDGRSKGGFSAKSGDKPKFNARNKKY